MTLAVSTDSSPGVSAVENIESEAAELEAKIAKIYRERIAEAYLISDWENRIGTLSNIGRDLYQCGDLNHTIQDAKNFGMALPDISRVLAGYNNISGALSIATDIQDDKVRGEIFRVISELSAESGDMSRAIDIMSMIPSQGTKGRTLEALVVLASKIQDKSKEEAAFRKIFRYCKQCYNFDCAFRVAMHICNIEGKIDPFQDLAKLVSTIDDVKLRDKILEGISQVFVQNGDVAGATDIAETLICPLRKKYALQTIIDALIKKGDIDGAIKIVSKIPDEVSRGRSLRGVVDALLENGDLLRATETAEMISCVEEKKWALKSIVHVLIKNGDLDGATILTEKILDEKIRGILLRDIVFALKKKGDIAKATETAQRIPNEIIKNWVLQEISSER